jgi:hypothetical protein
MSDPSKKGRGSMIARISINACAFHGWIVGWAVMTFGSALMVSILGEGSNGIAGTAFNGFEIADAIPPIGKLTLGSIFAALLYLGHRAGFQRIGAPIAGAIAFAAALILPISYYPEESNSGLLWLVHLASGAVGGLIALLVGTRCDRRRKSANDRKSINRVD